MDLMLSSPDAGINNPIAVNHNFDANRPLETASDYDLNAKLGYHGSNASWSALSGELDNGSVPSVAEYLQDNPGATYEDALKYMSQYSDEWAEKLLDYYMSQDSINQANEYNASREDTAYQRLVADLKAAGLNPAMMYGNSASPVGSAASGVYSPSGSASNTRVSNISKIKNLLLNAVLGEWQITSQNTQNWLKGFDVVRKYLFGALKLFGE